MSKRQTANEARCIQEMDGKQNFAQILRVKNLTGLMGDRLGSSSSKQELRSMKGDKKLYTVNQVTRGTLLYEVMHKYFHTTSM